MTHARFCRARLLARALSAANFLHWHARFQDAAQVRAILGDQGWRRPAPIRFLVTVLVVAYAGFVTTDVQAHPHVWVTMTTELVYAPDGSVTAVRHAWTFDDMFSAFATQGLEQKTKGQFTREELGPLAKVNVESLQEYAYFTYVKVKGKRQKDALSDPIDYYLEYDPKETVLTLHFTLPFKTPVKAKALDVEVYDPDFFIDFGFAEKDQVRLVNALAQCSVFVAKPRDDFFSAAVRLDKSMAWEANAGMGASFANRISVNCP
jgi:ABC-type uncharacterized transport system substrate-binding protein